MAGKKRLLVAAMITVFGVLAIAGPALAAMLTAELTGEAEVDGAGNRDQGDLDGTGTANLRTIPKKEKVCYNITVSDIEPATAAHIHKAPAGVNGPIVKGLRAPTDGSSQGCVRMGRKQITMINRNPSAFYVNVHNGDFPNGALRGQLTPSP
jgi:CHRD domain-containing protein